MDHAWINYVFSGLQTATPLHRNLEKKMPTTCPKNKLMMFAPILGLLLPLPAQAALEARHLDGSSTVNAYYDTVLDVTWLQNANLAATNTFGVSGILTGVDAGKMSWSTAQQWITAMNSQNYLGQNSWMLPSALNQNGSGPCGGYNCTGGMMGELFYTEGGLVAYQVITASPVLKNNFSNMKVWLYWYSTVFAPNADYAWAFVTAGGYQGGTDKIENLYAWPVLSGDVAAIPEPETWAMLLVGLGLTGLRLWQRRRQLQA